MLTTVADEIGKQLTLGLRRLGRRPLFTATGVAILGSGIGVSTVMFSLVDGVLLRPLPVRDPGRLHVMWATRRASPSDHIPLTIYEYRTFADHARLLAGVAAVDFRGTFPRPVGEGSDATLGNVSYVSGTFPEVLGLVPIVGRILRVEDDQSGATPVVMISHRFWRKRYNAAPSVIGRKLLVAGRLATIGGIVPPGFDFPRGTDVWAPLLPFTSRAHNDSSGVLLDLVVRLAPRATHVQARAELSAFLATRGAAGNSPGTLVAASRPLTEAVVGSARAILLALGASVGLLLFMTCANTVALLLSRISAREEEFAVLVALGADRLRTAVGPMTECAILTAGGGVAGVAIATAILRVLITLAPAELPRLDVVGVDGRTLAYTAVMSLAVAVVVASVPMAAVGRADPMTMLRGARTVAPTGRRWTQSLVVAQVAVALTVLIGAGLVLRSVHRLTRVELGFQLERLLVVRVVAAGGRFLTIPQARAEMQRIVDALALTPGVVSASPILIPPFTGEIGWDVPYPVGGSSVSSDQAGPQINLMTATPNTLPTLGIVIEEGRNFDNDDGEGSGRVVIVSASLARMLWPGREPLGQHVPLGGRTWNVVGVADDTHYRELETVRPTVYVPESQAELLSTYVAIRTRGTPEQLVPAVRRVITEAAPAMAILSVMPAKQLLDEPLASRRFSALLLGVIAGAVVLLAAAGLYGTMGTLVAERQREIGLRLALGATATRITILFVRRGLKSALSGVALGLILAFAATRVLNSLLYGITPTDPLTFAAAVAVLLATAVAACAIPAGRATRVDVSAMLRDT